MPDSSVQKLLGIPRRTFYRRLANGILTPPAGRLGKNRRGWSAGDLELAREQLSIRVRRPPL